MSGCSQKIRTPSATVSAAAADKTGVNGPLTAGVPAPSPARAEHPGSAGPRGVVELTAELETVEFAGGTDFVGQLAAAAEIERAATTLGATGLMMCARLVQADLRYGNGDLDAVGVVARIHQWAVAHQELALLSGSHSLLQRISANVGDPAASLEHALASVELLDRIDASPLRRARYLMRLGNALGEAKSFEDSRERYRQALELATVIGDVWLQTAVLTNMSCNESDAGQPQRAVETAETMAAVAAAGGIALNLLTLSHLAEAYIGVGRYAEAEQTLLAGLHDDTLPAVQLNDRAMALFYLAQAQRRRGALDRAQDSLQRCQQICDERDLVWDQVHIKQEWAALYAAQGHFERAYQLHQDFHAASEALHSTEREAQARTRQAMYETTEARQQAHLYHEQARRDPLTGLHNRRHVDEHLPALIEHAARTGDPLIVALVDLDHFKRVNDTCSHETGDQVLVTVAGLLTAAIPPTTGAPTGGSAVRPGGFAARLGGEEFLLVLTGMSGTQTVYLLDDLRRTIAAHPWQPITGELPVTVSIGVSAAQPTSTQGGLLARADESLYTAKHDGRNRVHVDSTTVLAERRSYRDGRPLNAQRP